MQADAFPAVHFDRSFGAERRERLRQLFAGRVHLSIGEIQAALHTSLATVRRDLMALEEQGIVSRVHGGAVACRHAGTGARGSRKAGVSGGKHRLE